MEVLVSYVQRHWDLDIWKHNSATYSEERPLELLGKASREYGAVSASVSIVHCEDNEPTVILIILLLQLFESSGISLMADSQYNGETRVQVLLEYLQVGQ